MKNSRFACLVIFILIVPLVSFAGDKPVVHVGFDIVQEGYRSNFVSEDFEKIQADVTSWLAGALDERFGFIRFTDQEEANKLKTTLENRRDTAISAAVPEVGFYLELTGPAVEIKPKAVYWMFRSPENFALVSEDPGVFTDEITISLKSYLEKNENELIGQLFSKVVLSQEAYIIPRVHWWVLPFSQQELGVDVFSKFSIKNQYQHPMGPTILRQYTVQVIQVAPQLDGVPPKYRSGLLTEAIPEQPKLEDVTRFENMQPTRIFIKEYIPSISPAVELSEPGGSNPEN